MRLSGFRWIRSMNSLVGLCLSLVLVGLIAAGAIWCTIPSSTVGKLPGVQVCQAEPLEQDYVASAPVAIGGKGPVIQVFKATPMVLDTPTSTAIYTYKVKNATNVQINEAGSAIKNISNPSAAALNGTATGLPASAIPTDGSGKFITVLIASNAAGSVKAELTLSFSEKLLASGMPAEETEPQDNGTEPRSPKWLAQYPSQLAPTRSSMSGTEPKFFDCPSDCDYCLKPEEAKSQGMGERCSEERCYYSPDDQQNWYCYKPAPGWGCYNLQVTQTTMDECNRIGGSWFLTQAEALERCQPMGYCCRNSQIYSATQSQCLQEGGTYYANPVEAKERCLPPCYCCLRGQVYQTSQSQCIQSGGNCYDSLAQAYERCQPPCWCCANGKVFQATQTQCIQSGGNCYTTQAEALRYCQQQSTCWCCANGKVFQTTQSQCLQSGGSCYSSYEQAQQYCRPVTTTPPLR